MDFKALQEKAKKYGKNLWETLNWHLNTGIEKLENSKFVVSDEASLEEIISSTKDTTNSYGKISRKKTIVIFVEKWSDFYKHLLSYMLPIIYGKAWTQNIWVKISNLEKEKLQKYDITEIPALAVFGDTEIIKVIYGKEAIEKVVKNTNVDINELITNL